MSCPDCKLDYIEDKLAVLEAAMRQITNVITYSENSAEVLRAQKSIIDTIKDFERRWDGRQCKHVTVIGEEAIYRVTTDVRTNPASEPPIDKPAKKRGRPAKAGRPGTTADSLRGDDAGGKTV